ncbi:MAG: hypothetical protein ABIR29_14760 [Chthoniobacterales bacterium]
MTKEELYAHPGWQWCTFEGAELQTLLIGLQTTFREKLEWLEDAENLTLQLRAAGEAAASTSKAAPDGS